MTQCPICLIENTNVEQHPQREAYNFRCSNCGDFSLAGSATELAKHIPDNDRWLVSAWVRNNPQQMPFHTEQLKIAENFIRPKILDRAYLLFAYIFKHYEFNGFHFNQLLPSRPATDWTSFAGMSENNSFKKEPAEAQKIDEAQQVSYSKDVNELKFLISQILCKELGFLDCEKKRYYVTAKGLLWSEGHTSLKSKTGFVAMWFGGENRFQEMQQVFELGFKKGAQAANLDATRIDRQPFNGKIIDQIESEIKRAPFVIADLTANRGGVYYEAGLAAGLGIPVIWTCEDEPSSTDNIHFDIQPYNQIRWKKDNLQGLAEQIRWRLANTIK